MIKQQIVVLANSVKHHQHCVAGKRIDGAGWVRPVSDKFGAELSNDQAKCQNPYGSFNVKPLQKVTLGLKCHVPLVNQPENYLIDEFTWQQNYKIHEMELKQFLDFPDSIWGTADRVEFGKIQCGSIKIDQSLYLVEVNDLKLYTNNCEKRRAKFTYNGIPYDFAVTDPRYEYLIRNSDELQGVLCISLGEEFKGNCFKLVAAVF